MFFCYYNRWDILGKYKDYYIYCGIQEKDNICFYLCCRIIYWDRKNKFFCDLNSSIVLGLCFLVGF